MMSDWTEFLQAHLLCGNKVNTGTCTSDKYDKTAKPEYQKAIRDAEMSKAYYRLAVKFERRGKVVEALDCFRRATDLDNFVIFRCGYRLHMNLMDRFQNDIDQQYKGRLFAKSYPLKISEDTSTHISDLPIELIMHILKYVVSGHLDTKSLEQCAAVSKGFYICCRDEQLWRRACQKIWGKSLGTLSVVTEEEYDAQNKEEYETHIHNKRQKFNKRWGIYTSWRQMYNERPRVQIGGYYCGKSSKISLNRNTARDVFAPHENVEYRRYLRFMGNRVCYLLTTKKTVLESMNLMNSLDLSTGELMKGEYTLNRDVVHLTFKDQTNSKVVQRIAKKLNYPVDKCSVTFYLHYTIEHTWKEKFSKLVFTHYSYMCNYNGNKSLTNLSSAIPCFLPLWFHPKENCQARSEGPLN